MHGAMPPGTHLALSLAQGMRSSEREAGEGIFRSASVEITETQRSRFFGLAFEDDESFDVALDLTPYEIRGMCDCDMPQGGCRHLYALALALDATGRAGQPARKAEEPGWKDRVADVAAAMAASRPPPNATNTPPKRVLVCGLDADRTRATGVVHLETLWRRRRKDGSFGPTVPAAIGTWMSGSLIDPNERAVASLLGPGHTQDHFQVPFRSALARHVRAMDADRAADVLPALAATGRLFAIREGAISDIRIRIDEDGPYRFGLSVTPQEDGRAFVLDGYLERGASRIPISAPLTLLRNGPVLLDDRLITSRFGDAYVWVLELRQRGPIRIPAADLDSLIEQILQTQDLSAIELPPPWSVGGPDIQPVGVLRIQGRPDGARGRLPCTIRFDYGGVTVDSAAPVEILRIPGRDHHLVMRDRDEEKRRKDRVLALGVLPSIEGPVVEVASIPHIVASLSAEGFRVEAEGGAIRPPGAFHLSVTTGIDWFDVEGGADFGGRQVPLPEILDALRRDARYVQLGDGSFGILPEAWIGRWGALAGLGEVAGSAIRFLRSQALVLDALLAVAERPDVDATFAAIRERLRGFDGVREIGEPAGFRGTLRPYQRQGVGWLDFLRTFGLGGCLADDMGLGKTVQVLAMLGTMKSKGGTGRPTLVVCPKSIVHNWIDEARRFTPELDVLDYTGPGREARRDGIARADLVVISYGILRMDIETLREIRFDTAILDEAQAIKNAASQTAKAARLLAADHRLALSGTPIENHLGELWSLFEFLNPGMLGRKGGFEQTFVNSPGSGLDADRREALARAIRPVILRRTKTQVAKDLPDRTEQTLVVELEAGEREIYDGIRDHYRTSLRKRIATDGMGKSRIHVLEALLRMRQAACHPGLLDPKRKDAPSTKIESLLSNLEEILDEGHKALVFSQFTSLLALVRPHLDRRGMVYEYLDGSTRDRAQHVERFQTDPACRLFLISLKAGGLGLNLTAADYVFLLDPWWNPAAEAQAIDRTHRIGQTRPVVAYRLIAKDTIEEKILALQERKRGLAEAIIREDAGFLRSMSAEDLEMLLA